MTHRTRRVEFIEMTSAVSVTARKVFLIMHEPVELGVHVAFGTSGTNPICIGCGCCSARGKDPFYCGQCLRGVPRP